MSGGAGRGRGRTPTPLTVRLRRSSRLQSRAPASTAGEGGGDEDDGGTKKRVRLDTGTGRGNDFHLEPNSAGGTGPGPEDTGAGAAAPGAEPGPMMTNQLSSSLGLENASAGRNEEPVNGEGSSGTMTQGLGAGSHGITEGPGRQEEAHRCLFNETILDNLFKFIVHQPGSSKDVATDVKNMRLVCHSWKDSVTRLYRRTEVSVDFGMRGPSDATSSLEVFLNTMKNSRLIPVQQFAFIGDTFFDHRNQNRNLKLFNDFIRICGPGMVTLKFMFVCGSKHVDKFNDNKINISDWNFTKLKALGIFTDESRLATTANYSSHGLTTLVGLFLSGAKKLNEFCFFDMTTPPSTQSDLLIRQMGETICSQVSTSVTGLHLRLILSEAAIGQLAGRGFELDTFTLIYSSGLGGGALFKFLESQANTLRRFEFSRRYPDQEEISLVVPRLPKLTQLDLTDRIAPPFSFGGSFPKLESLECPHMECESFSELLSHSRKNSPSLKILRLPDSFRLPAQIKEVHDHFPNITALQISPNPLEVAETLGQLFIHCGSLELLFIAIEQELNLDSILTGVAEEDCKRLQHRSLRNLDLEALPQKPSLLNLSKLQTLTLMNAFDEEASLVSISNFTAQFAFLRMSQLQELNLIGIRTQISPRCMGQLQDKLTLKVEVYEGE